MFLRRHLSLHNLGTHVRQEGPHATGPSERQLLVTIGLPKQFHFTYSCLPLYSKLIQSLSSGSAFAPNKADRRGGDPQKPLEGTKWCRKICKKMDEPLAAAA